MVTSEAVGTRGASRSSQLCLALMAPAQWWRWGHVFAASRSVIESIPIAGLTRKGAFTLSTSPYRRIGLLQFLGCSILNTGVRSRLRGLLLCRESTMHFT